MTENWKEIHPDFTEELQKEWEEGFDYEEVKEWVDIGLNPVDINYASWLKYIKLNKIASRELLELLMNYPNKEELRDEYSEYKEWIGIHKDFYGGWWNNYQNKWKNLNFTLQTTKSWIKMGFEPKDYELVAYCRSKGYQFKKANSEEVKKEYEDWIKKSKSSQEYLDLIYSKERRSEISELHIPQKNLKGTLELNDFITIKKLDCWSNELISLDLTNCEKLEEIDCSNNEITDLTLPRNCFNLAKLCCINNKLTNLNFSVLNSEKLEILSIINNNFSPSDLSVFSFFNSLEVLNIGNFGLVGEIQIKNNIYNRFFGSLEPLKNLTKLTFLNISNTDINSGFEYLPNSIENIFFFSKERPESKIKEIAKQLEWIGEEFGVQQVKEWMKLGLKPNELAFAVYLKSKGCDPKQKDLNLEAWRGKWKKISKQSKKWLDKNYPKKERSEVEEIYLNKPSLKGELDFEDFTHEHHKYGVKVLISLAVDETKLTLNNLSREAEVIKCVNAQTWLDENYPQEGVCREENGLDNKNKTRVEITKLDIKRKNLESPLNLSNFVNLKKLDCSYNKLTSLKLSSCSRLEKVDCSYNQLTNLDLSNCFHLIKLYCGNNLLTNLNLPLSYANLKKLDLSINKFNIDLFFLSFYTNLEWLNLNYNKFIGSLVYLSSMEKLEFLDISNTDIDEVDIDKLPSSLERIYYSVDKRPDCKLTTIISQLEKYEWKDIHSDFILWKRRGWEKQGFSKGEVKEWIEVEVEPQDYKFAGYSRDIKKLTSQKFLDNKNKEDYQEIRRKCNEFGWCRQCQQPNTSENWCHPCQEQKWQVGLKQLTGQQLIEKFIQQQQLRESDKDKKLEWIPYHNFTDILYLVKGGFSKIYKTKWEREKETWESDYVVLKSLNNSQNITLEFLSEIANTKLFKSYNRIVECYGISQDPTTKNYVMVMKYIDKGNLRQYLQERSEELSLGSKLSYLLTDIAEGLKSIHYQDLVHWDLHSGNVLVKFGECYITDLGLSELVNSQKKDGKIFGVLPYVAPEVLMGKTYTQASDVYSFGIVAYELLANAYPYTDTNLEGTNLALKICRGLRPNIDKVSIPQLLKDLIKSCWDANPKKRPTAEKLWDIIGDWNIETEEKKDTEFKQQYQAIEKEYNTFSQNTPYKIHPNSTTNSKMIDTKQITELLERSSKPYNSQLYQDSELLDLDFLKEQKSIFSNHDWINIHPNFNSNLIEKWNSNGFTYSQTQHWINIHSPAQRAQAIKEPEFYAYLRDIVKLTPKQVLNDNSISVADLREQFREYKENQQLEANVEITSK